MLDRVVFSQGCILSSTLFSLYTEELAARVRRMDVGMKVGKDKICMLLYEDDVVVMSECRRTTKYFRCDRTVWRKLWSEKSKILIVNRSEDEYNTTWLLEEKELQQTKGYK